MAADRALRTDRCQPDRQYGAENWQQYHSTACQ